MIDDFRHVFNWMEHFLLPKLDSFGYEFPFYCFFNWLNFYGHTLTLKSTHIFTNNLFYTVACVHFLFVQLFLCRGSSLDSAASNLVNVKKGKKRTISDDATLNIGASMLMLIQVVFHSLYSCSFLSIANSYCSACCVSEVISP